MQSSHALLRFSVIAILGTVLALTSVGIVAWLTLQPYITVLSVLPQERTVLYLHTRDGALPHWLTRTPPQTEGVLAELAIVQHNDGSGTTLVHRADGGTIVNLTEDLSRSSWETPLQTDPLIRTILRDDTASFLWLRPTALPATEGDVGALVRAFLGPRATLLAVQDNDAGTVLIQGAGLPLAAAPLPVLQGDLSLAAANPGALLATLAERLFRERPELAQGLQGIVDAHWSSYGISPDAQQLIGSGPAAWSWSHEGSSSPRWTLALSPSTPAAHEELNAVIAGVLGQGSVRQTPLLDGRTWVDVVSTVPPAESLEGWTVRAGESGMWSATGEDTLRLGSGGTPDVSPEEWSPASVLSLSITRDALLTWLQSSAPFLVADAETWWETYLGAETTQLHLTMDALGTITRIRWQRVTTL